MARLRGRNRSQKNPPKSCQVARPPICLSRSKTVTWCPSRASFLASAIPMRPAPITPISRPPIVHDALKSRSFIARRCHSMVSFNPSSKGTWAFTPKMV